MQAAKILVVDDDAVARELLAEALKKEGYDVEAFGSGEAAIARGREGRVDLVLTDIRMGAVDGLTVLREFKRMSQDTAIVVLTAFGSLEGAIEAIKQGAYDYLASPLRRRRSSSSFNAASTTAACYGRIQNSVKNSRVKTNGRRWSEAARRCWKSTSWSLVCPRARARCCCKERAGQGKS